MKRTGHSGDCNWWSTKICDCGWLLYTVSKTHGSKPTDAFYEQWATHLKLIDEASPNAERVKRLEEALHKCVDTLRSGKIIQLHGFPYRALHEDDVADAAVKAQSALDAGKEKGK